VPRGAAPRPHHLAARADIDASNADLAPLRSFVLPGGGRAAAALHPARTTSRRAERLMVRLAREEPDRVGQPALLYMNRLSDFFFVASRFAKGEGDVLWVPGKNRRRLASSRPDLN